MDIDLYVISAVLVALTMLTLVVGYARVLLTAHSAAFQIAFSTCLVFFAFAARAWFWDIGPLVYADFNDWNTRVEHQPVLQPDGGLGCDARALRPLPDVAC